MLLTKPQLTYFWRLWGNLINQYQWDKTEAETQRKSALKRAGFTSLTEVTKTNGFDDLIAELKALEKPSEIAPQMRQVLMPRTRMIVKIQTELCTHLATVLNGGQKTDDERAAEAYILTIMRTKYKAQTFDDLQDQQLRMLIVDITRAVNQKRKTLGLTWPDLDVIAASEQLPARVPCY